ncbi:MAG TPA: T9SS type A sorting domain-containing protein, partial [Rubricoccaceae bacterium]
LSSPTTVTVGVYNTLGQRVAVLAQDAPLSAGTHALALQTGSLAAGVYVVRVEAGGDVSTHKVTVVR